MGLAVDLDIQYSDNLVDPGTQNPPTAWANITDLQTLKDSVYNYTYSILSQLNANGLMPEIVQIGDETNCWMMITSTNPGSPDLNGCNGHWQELGAVMNSGIKPVPDVSANSTAQTKIALYIADPAYMDWWFARITNAGRVTDFDIVGMLYYPLCDTAFAII